MTIEPLLWMLIGHALADFPLQGDFLAKAKNPNVHVIPGESVWLVSLLSHSAIHAGAVKLATGSWLLAAAEAIAHFTIDATKNTGAIGFNLDQALHVGCKVFWWTVLVTLLR
jgi:hypothetical protein